MDKFQRRVMESLKEVGAEPCRQSGHLIFRLPNGHNFVIASTPSDWRSWRNAASNLKRALNASSPKHVIVESAKESLTKRIRTRIPNREPLERNREFVLRLGSTTGEHSSTTPAPSESLYYGSIAAILIAAQSVEPFWSLDLYGKIRLLQKLTSHFEESTVVATMFNLAELSGDRPPSTDDLQNASNLLSGSTWLRHCKDWNCTGIPALFVRDPELGDVIIEVGACISTTGRSDIAVIPAVFDSQGTFFASWPLWNPDPTSEDAWSVERPNKLVTYTFANKKGMDRWDIRHSSSGQWTDPKATREPLSKFMENLIKYTQEENENNQ